MDADDPVIGPYSVVVGEEIVLKTPDAAYHRVSLEDGSLERLPAVVSTGIVKLGDLQIEVHVLDDGRRVIDSESVDALMRFLLGEAR